MMYIVRYKDKYYEKHDWFYLIYKNLDEAAESYVYYNQTTRFPTITEIELIEVLESRVISETKRRL